MKLNIQLFASGTVDNFTKVKGTTSATLQGKIEWSSVGDATTNKSIVTTNLYARRTDNYTSTPTSGKNWKGSVKVGNNATHSFSTLSKNTSVASNWVLFATYTDEIEHDTDGTKTITISGSVTGATGTSLEGKTSSGSKTFALDQLHKLPDEITFDILEVNEDLINAGVSNDTFVKDLSIKSFNISGNTYDNATIKEYGILNRIVPYGTATLPLIIDFSQNEILTDLTYVTKVPITGRIIDSYNTAGYSETLLFDYVSYNKINLIETSTTVKRNGQTSGKVKLNVNGNLYNGVVGNVDQSAFKPIVKYKFWQTGTEEPTTYDYEIPSNNITIENGVFNVNNYEIGSSVETDINWFNPDNAYKIKVYVKDNFTSYESQEKSIAVGEATWTEYKDRVDFKKITIKGQKISLNKSIITAGLKSSKSIAFSTYAEIKISLDNELKFGNKLTLANGSVVVGKDVKLVKVNANARLDASANATVYALKIWIHKNDGTLKKVFAHYFYKVNTSYDLPMCITSALVEVKEGDTISLITQAAASQTKNLISPDTYLTVEVID